uniref:hypothetical protein n=1 Tax=Enterococcus italicus TaxID=246144 RepID=UPI00207499E4
IKNTLSRPTFIVTDKDNPERLNYIGVHIVTFSNEEKKIKPIIVVAEESNKGYTDLEVVTIMIKGSLSEKMHEQREVLYDINK